MWETSIREFNTSFFVIWQAEIFLFINNQKLSLACCVGMLQIWVEIFASGDDVGSWTMWFVEMVKSPALLFQNYWEYYFVPYSIFDNTAVLCRLFFFFFFHEYSEKWLISIPHINRSWILERQFGGERDRDYCWKAWTRRSHSTSKMNEQDWVLLISVDSSVWGVFNNFLITCSKIKSLFLSIFMISIICF